MPADVQSDLFFFFEDMGAYRHALDAIMIYLGRAEYPQEIFPYLEAFCQRMLDLPEDQLRAGGLTRAEVEAAMAGKSHS